MASTPFSLSAQECEEFMTNGFVRIRGAFPTMTAKLCRESIWRLLEEEKGICKDPASWSHVKVSKIIFLYVCLSDRQIGN